MHCELLVPGLFAAAAGERFPGLELLLGRGRASHEPPCTVESWLGARFGLEEDPLPAGALSALSRGIAPGDALWARADPVHLHLARDRLILAPHGAFQVAAAEAEALCEALNRHFAGSFELQPVLPHAWCAKLDAPLGLNAPSPLEMAGRDVELVVPRGTAVGYAQRVLNEAQMVLHAHPVNEAREARGEPALNSLWLWGEGKLPPRASSPWHAVLCDDAVLGGLARAAGMRERGLPRNAAEWLESAAEQGRALVLLDCLRLPLALSQEAEYRACLNDLERDWFAPLLAALRAGRIGMVTAHVPDAGASFETIRGDLRRFWRRVKGLEAYA